MQARCTFVVPILQITVSPGEYSPSDDTDSITPVIPKTVYNSASIESVLEDVRNTFSCTKVVGIRSNVGTLRIPTFRNSNTGINDTSSVASPRKILEQRLTELIQ